MKYVIDTSLTSTMEVEATSPQFWMKCKVLNQAQSNYYYFFLRQGFSVDLESVLELALVDQAGLKLAEIHLPLPPECWD